MLHLEIRRKAERCGSTDKVGKAYRDVHDVDSVRAFAATFPSTGYTVRSYTCSQVRGHVHVGVGVCYLTGGK